MTNPVAPRAEGTVYLVDDDDGMRRGMEFLLRSAGFRTKAFDSGQALLDGVEPGVRGCLLLDVQMPGMSGLEVQEELSRRGVEMPVVLVTAFANVPMAVRAMKAGAMDFIEKPFESAALLDRVRRALSAEARRHAGSARRAELAARCEQLTDREREVMELVVQGLLNKQIAGELDIAMKTVEHHRARVMEKMRAESLADLVRMSIELE